MTPIDTATNKALRPITVPPGVTAIAITPNRKTVYVSSRERYGPGTNCSGPPVPANTVTPISTATRKAGKPIYVGAGPGAIAIAPNGITAYVLTARGLVPIRTATSKRGKVIKGTAGASAIAIAPNGNTAYVTGPVTYTGGYSRTALTAIRTATNTITKVITIRSKQSIEISAIGITPNGRTAYLLNVLFEPGAPNGTVIPLRIATGTVGTPITVAPGPAAIVFTR